MTQTQPQFQRPLLRIGSIAFLEGAVIAIVSTVIHPSTEDPSNHPLVFTKYASSDSWIAIHIGQFAGVIMVFAGGFVTLFRLFAQSESSMAFYTSVDWSCYNWCLHDNLFCLGWNPRRFYVEKIID